MQHQILKVLQPLSICRNVIRDCVNRVKVMSPKCLGATFPQQKINRISY
jgi:hypothetical protein